MFGLDCQTKGNGTSDHTSVREKDTLLELQGFLGSEQQKSVLSQQDREESAGYNKYQLDSNEGKGPVLLGLLEDSKSNVAKDERLCEVSKRLESHCTH